MIVDYGKSIDVIQVTNEDDQLYSIDDIWL